MRKKSKKVYALYKGEECLGIGTKYELSEQLGVKPYTIYFYSTPTYKKRCKGNNRRELVLVEE